MSHFRMSPLTSTAMVMVAAALLLTVYAQSPDVPPTADQFCDTTTLTPCLAFLGSGESSMKPSDLCCNPVNEAMKNETQRACLCSMLTNTDLLKAAGVDPSKAALLPEMCNSDYKGVDVCSLATAPTPSPAMTPAGPALAPNSVASGPPPYPGPTSATTPPKSDTDAPEKSSGLALANTCWTGVSGLLFAMFATL